MDSFFEDALSEPFQGEGRVTDLLRSHGASDTAVMAVVSAARLLKYVEPEFSQPTVWRIEKALFPRAAHPKRRAVQKPDVPATERRALDQRLADLTKSATEAQEAAGRALDRPLNDAYSAITRRADALVAKSSSPISRDEAITKAMELDPSMYDDYVRALETRQLEEHASEQAVRQRDLDDWEARREFA